MNSRHPSDITVVEVHKLMQQAEDFLLLDCRTPQEVGIAVLPSATLIPMDEIPDRLGELVSNRDRRIVVYCHHGGRSARTAHWLRSQGFTCVQNMLGGIDQWTVEIDPSLPRY